MARSTLLGIDRPPPRVTGNDTAALGPSDSSDSGSDIAGEEFLPGADPGDPVDVATRPDGQIPDSPIEASLPGLSSDSRGTGERRSAVNDAGERDGSDIAPDRITEGLPDDDYEDDIALDADDDDELDRSEPT